jgi:hypothetical protein
MLAARNRPGIETSAHLPASGGHQLLLRQAHKRYCKLTIAARHLRVRSIGRAA